MTTKSKLHLLLFFLFASIYLLPLGCRPLMEPDETRYAEIPREMIASGDWAVPHLNGLRYFEKPPLGYWLNAVSILGFGENAFAIRLPSALSVGLSALLIMLLIRRACPAGEVWAGPLAGLVFLTSLEVAAIGTFSVLDSMLAATLTLTMVCFFLASQAERASRRQYQLLLAAGISCGLAFLIKGFLALVVPALSLGAYLVWQRRFRDLLGLAWLPLIIAILTALPWSLAIHSREPDFWNFFFWNEHVRRFLGGESSQHTEPFWSFILTAQALFLPWTFLAPAVGRGLQKGPPNQALIRFCLAWFCLPFLFFSLSSGKLLTYILPCFPPFAILTSLGLLNLLRAGRTRLFQFGAIAAAIVFSLLTVAFFAIQFVGVTGIAPPYAHQSSGLLALACLTTMALLPLTACRAKEWGPKLVLFGLCMTFTLGAAPFLMPDESIEKKSPGALLLSQAKKIDGDTIVLSDVESFRAACWFLKRTDIQLVGTGGELTYGLKYEDARGRLLTKAQAKDKIIAHPGKIVLVARVRNYKKWGANLPPPISIDDNGPDGYILARY